MTTATHFGDKRTDEKAGAVLPKGSKTPVSTSGSATNAPAPSSAPTSRRAMAAKEVIPFAWKLVGYSAGIPVTLFKAIERDDVELQLARVERDGYYKDLKVLDINTKVEQPKKPAEPRSKKTRAKKTAKPAAKRRPKKSGSAKAARKTSPKATKKASPKKTAAKAVKKKKSPAKKTAKRKAKRR